MTLALLNIRFIVDNFFIFLADLLCVVCFDEICSLMEKVYFQTFEMKINICC